MKYIYEELKVYKIEALLAPLFKMLEAFFDLLVPLVVARMINIGIVSKDLQYVYKQIVLLIILALVGITCSITAQYFAAKASVKVASKLRLKLYNHIQSLSFKELDTIGISTLITRITSDINQIQNGINMTLRLLLRSPFIVVGSMIMAMIINKQISLIFITMIIILSLIIYFLMSYTNPGYKEIQKKLDLITSKTRENLTGIRVIRAFSKEEDEVNEFVETNEDYNLKQRKVGQISSLMNPLTYVVVNLAIVAILYFGSQFINQGIMLNGDIVALINYTSQVLIELVKFASTIILMSKTIASSNRIKEVFDTTSSLSYGDVKTNHNHKYLYEFKNVSLSYNNSEESISNLNFKIKRGQTVGIIGGTGSGKTTIVNLLARFYDPSSGEIIYDGENIKNYTKDALTSRIHVVMQKAQLFEGTIRSNLLMSNQEATDQQIYQALKIAQALEIVENKTMHLDEKVEQGGRNFSGGQRQRLSIARAIVSKSDVLILDDSASALDFATDASLRTSLKTLKEMTTVIISQRTSSIQHADFILVLEDGQVVGQGTHDELLENCEIYKEIYESQFKKGDVYGK